MADLFISTLECLVNNLHEYKDDEKVIALVNKAKWMISSEDQVDNELRRLIGKHPELDDYLEQHGTIYCDTTWAILEACRRGCESSAAQICQFSEVFKNEEYLDNLMCLLIDEGFMSALGGIRDYGLKASLKVVKYSLNNGAIHYLSFDRSVAEEALKLAVDIKNYEAVKYIVSMMQ